MDSYLEWVRKFCLSLPRTTEKVRWEHNLLFCIGEKMYCIANLEPGASPSKIAFKCDPEKFAELVEIPGIIPAPYMARNHWVSVTEIDALRQAETEELIRSSYEMVRARLPKRLQLKLDGAQAAPAAKQRSRSKPARPQPVAKRRR